MSVACRISVCVHGYVTTCTCLHTYYMYLSTGGQSEVISTDPKIAPVNDQPSVYGELTNSGQIV